MESINKTTRNTHSIYETIINNHDHNEHKPIPVGDLLLCACGKSNTECHPCRHPNENCYYKDVGCQHPKRCEAIAGPYLNDNNKNNRLHTT